MRPDNRAVAQRNELEVLKVVRLFEHLRRIEIARAVWPNSSVKIAEHMAQRTIVRLIAQRELFQRPNALGSQSLLLARAGATRLCNLDIDAHSGYSQSTLNGTQFRHHSYESRYLIERIAQGHKAFGQHAISKGWAPISRQQFVASHKKVPDGLVLVPGSEYGSNSNEIPLADWIEVENTRKSAAEFASIFDIACKIDRFLDEGETVLLHRVIFVFDAGEPHERRIKAELKEYMTSHLTLDRERLSRIILCRCHVDFPFVWHGYDEIDCGALLETTVKDSTIRPVNEHQQ